MLPVAHFFDAPKGLQLPKVLQLFLDGSAAGGFGFATVCATPSAGDEMHAKDCHHALPGAAS